MDVIEKLNKLRLERNMSVYRLAELSGLNQSTLANTFSRGTVPSIRNLEIICNTLGITLAQFFTEEENTVPLKPWKTSSIPWRPPANRKNNKNRLSMPAGSPLFVRLLSLCARSSPLPVCRGHGLGVLPPLRPRCGKTGRDTKPL